MTELPANNNNDKDNLLNNLLNKYDKTYIIRSFSVRKEDLPIYFQFQEIAKREAPSKGGFSKVLVKAMEEYVKRHSAGNPQLLITHYVKPEAPTPMRVLCDYCGGALSDGEVYCRKAVMWIKSIRCYSCKNNRLVKR